MNNVVALPVQSSQNRRGAILETQGEEWNREEKRLLDRAEFLEAMILVLEDVKLQNIRNRDYGMMEVVNEEIIHYQERLEESQASLAELRKRSQTAK